LAPLSESVKAIPILAEKLGPDVAGRVDHGADQNTIRVLAVLDEV
jgi:hypothetical protein